MSYQALYRTWRPQSFASLMGQPHVRQTLMNALMSGHIAHAYLFCGPRGTGKTSAAKLFAKAVNCLRPNGAEPCNECDACVSITRGNNVDVEEIDAASNRGVDEIRELRDKVHYSPTSVKRKVYIVDEVHMLTTEAFNALLKTLEEPPDHVLFLLATTEPHRLPGTIISRCQRFDFHRIATETIVARLREVVEHQAWTVGDAALWKLAEAADGGMRDALGLLEQAAAFSNGAIDETHVATVIGGVDTEGLLGLVADLAAMNYLAALNRMSAWYAAGKDANRIAFDIGQVLRDLFIVLASPSDDALGGKPVDAYRKVVASQNVSSEWLLTGIGKLGELYTQLRYVEQPRLALESSLLSLASGVLSSQGGLEKSQASEAPRTVSPTRETAPPQGTAQPTASAEKPSAETPAAERASVASRRRADVDGRRGVSADRKRETLERFARDRDAAFEEVVRTRWGDVLHKVKADRIQTHAWLAHGEVALATDYAVVLSFASRIHREAVMKAADRQVIEMAFQVILERDLQLFALLKSDWDEFVATNEREAAPQPAEQDVENRIVERAVALFGEAKIIIEDEE